MVRGVEIRSADIGVKHPSPHSGGSYIPEVLPRIALGAGRVLKLESVQRVGMKRPQKAYHGKNVYYIELAGGYVHRTNTNIKRQFRDVSLQRGDDILLAFGEVYESRILVFFCL